MIKSEKNKSRFKLIGSLLILIFISCLIGYYLYYYFSNLQKEVLVTDYFGRTTVTQTEEKSNNKTSTNISSVHNNYIGILEISKINFKRGFYNIDDKNNNVNKNIQVIKNSDMPDVHNGMMIIAGHSGNGISAYFKNLYKLNIKDKASVYYNGIKYEYTINDIYKTEKDGNINIVREKDRNTLVLITCDKKDKTKQIVYILYLNNTYQY